MPLISAAGIVDLDLLKVDRRQASSRWDDLLEEDAFCDRMRKLGAKKWESGEEYIDAA